MRIAGLFPKVVFALILALSFPATNASADEIPQSSRFQEIHSGSAESPEDLTVTFRPTSFFESDFSIPPIEGSNWYTAVFPPCDEVTISNCIEALEMREVGSDTWRVGTLNYQFKAKNRSTLTAMRDPQNNRFWYYGDSAAEDNSLGINFGGASLWSFPNLVHEGGASYKVSVAYSTFAIGSAQTPNIFDFNVTPVKSYLPNNPATCTETAYLGPLDTQKLPSCGNGLSRISPEPKEFNYVAFDFPKNVEVRIKVRLGKLKSLMSTWFNGRIGKPEINMNSDSISISGTPLMVPFSKTSIIKCATLSASARALVRAALSESGQCGIGKSGYNWVAGSTTAKIDVGPIEIFKAYEPFVRELGKASYWSLTSFSENSKCKSDDLAGVVTSDAQVYATAVPTFNDVTRVLEYSIASPHLDSKGQPNSGNFSLALNKKYAQCLWGENVPLTKEYVQIQILNSDGNPKIGVISLRDLGDWIYVDISNFGFSVPKIGISFKDSEVKSPTSPPKVSTPAKSSATTKPSIAIKCKKGTKILAVKGTAPKCPSGYKKVL